MTQWTDERKVKLTKLWALGLSASQVAERLGGFEHCQDGGRSSVCGMVARLKLQRPPGTLDRTRASQRRSSLNSNLRRKQPAAAPVEAKTEVSERRPKQPPAPPPSEGYVDTQPLPPGVGKTLLYRDSEGRLQVNEELRRDDCRWGYGDPSKKDFSYCGEPCEGGLPYCPKHAQAAYLPAKKLRPKQGHHHPVRRRA